MLKRKKVRFCETVESKVDVKMKLKVVGIVTGLLLVGGIVAQAQPPAGAPKSGAPPAGKSQAELALKTGSFQKIVGTDSRVMGATKTNDLTKAKTLVGKTANFQGTVAKVFAPRSNSIVLLNFDKNYKNAVSAVVRSKDFAKFPNLMQLEGKKVLVTGKVSDFNGQPEVEVARASDIKLIP